MRRTTLRATLPNAGLPPSGTTIPVLPLGTRIEESCHGIILDDYNDTMSQDRDVLTYDRTSQSSLAAACRLVCSQIQYVR